MTDIIKSILAINNKAEVTVEEVADDYTIPQPEGIEIITPAKPALTLEQLQKQLEELQKKVI